MTDDPLSNLWPWLAALAGSYVALSLERFQSLSLRGKITVVTSSFLGSIFLGPLLINFYWDDLPADSKIIGGLYFALGASFMSLLPIIVEKMAGFGRLFGTKKGGGE